MTSRTVMTLRKLKTMMPSLKPPVTSMMRSNVVYQITCPRCKACYVGATTRHLRCRFSEHKSRKGCSVKQHINKCNVSLCEKDVIIIGYNNREDHISVGFFIKLNIRYLLLLKSDAFDITLTHLTEASWWSTPKESLPNKNKCVWIARWLILISSWNSPNNTPLTPRLESEPCHLSCDELLCLLLTHWDCDGEWDLWTKSSLEKPFILCLQWDSNI